MSQILFALCFPRIGQFNSGSSVKLVCNEHYERLFVRIITLSVRPRFVRLVTMLSLHCSCLFQLCRCHLDIGWWSINDTLSIKIPFQFKICINISGYFPSTTGFCLLVLPPSLLFFDLHTSLRILMREEGRDVISAFRCIQLPLFFIALLLLHMIISAHKLWAGYIRQTSGPRSDRC